METPWYCIADRFINSAKKGSPLSRHGGTLLGAGPGGFKFKIKFPFQEILGVGPMRFRPALENLGGLIILFP